jgi:cardiolipin synthase A/B
MIPSGRLEPGFIEKTQCAANPDTDMIRYMEFALPRQAAPATEPRMADATVARPPELEQECREGTGGHSPAGVSPGVNIAPGSDDDGWIVPDPVVLRDGTQVQLYKDGEALHAAYEAIARAKFLICLEVYIFANDETGRTFTDLLCRKARQGVRVHVLYDAVGSLEAKDLFKRLAAAGVRLGAFHPIFPWELKFGWRPWNRDHRKLLVIDNELAGMGGLNLGANYAGSWLVRNVRNLGGAVGGRRVGNVLGSAAARVAGTTPSSAIGDIDGDGMAENPDCDFWRDTAIGIRGPGAKLMQQAFARSWTYVTHGGRVRRAEYIHGLDCGENEMGVLASVPTMNSPLSALLCRLMRGARESLLMTMAYFVPEDEMIEELCRAARRGVRMRLMLPGRSDVKVVQIAARSFYEKLMSCGIEIYERQVVVLHAKTMVIDGRTSLVGSTNLDYRSIEYNCELSTLIRSEPFGRQMTVLFENDVRYAKRIELSEWRRRPLADRVVQWAVSRARYLM